MRRLGWTLSTLVLTGLTAQVGMAQTDAGTVDPVARFAFDANASDLGGALGDLLGEGSTYVQGLDGQALQVRAPLECGKGEQLLGGEKDFSTQFWVRTVAGSDKRMVLLSKKLFPSNSLHSQKQKGWAFYLSNGTWAWSMGAGRRRVTYERDNGRIMALNDGRWHQLTMTFDSKASHARLYFDGIERALYNVGDSDGFGFASDSPLTVGQFSAHADSQADSGPTIEEGCQKIQALVDAFNAIGTDPVQPEEFADLIVNPKKLLADKTAAKAERLGDGAQGFLESIAKADQDAIGQAESALMRSPYTVHQSHAFTEVAPVTRLYALSDGRVIIREDAAKAVAAQERLHAPDFDMDNLIVWDRVLSRDEVLASYTDHFKPVPAEPLERISAITAAAWNIEHGGIHFTMAKDGWDSRETIAEMIRREGIDLIMMQETYSSGDYLAAELGYYFAESIDWDYLNQGANISVLSRYPIEEIYVPAEATFSNLGVKVSLSKTQDMYVMSNWYGMNKFEGVFDFHKQRFAESDTTPTLFSGDFNAVPHTDGGKSPASSKLLDSGFVDAYRSLHKDVRKHPGYSHSSGSRIDQFYYKGASLKNTSTRVVSTWPTGFPSDHYLLIASFDLDPVTSKSE